MPAENDIQKQIRKFEREQLKRMFETLWKQLDGPELEPEHQFSDSRKWAFDYAEAQVLVAIELEGGTWLPGGGRHNRAKGYSDDCQKYNSATHLGWRLFRFTSDMLVDDPAGHLLPVIELIEESKAIKPDC